MHKIFEILEWLREQHQYVLFFTEDVFQERQHTTPQMKRCVRAIVDKSGNVSRDSISRAFAICTSSLQKKGYLKKGTNRPTKKGMQRGKSKAAEKGHKEKLQDYESMLAAVKTESKENLFEKFKKKHGIIPQKAHSSHNVHSIGFSEKEKKWYGWSHRAVVGFGIGDKIFEPNFGDDNTPFVKHGSKVIKNMTDAENAARAFAKYVS